MFRFHEKVFTFQENIDEQREILLFVKDGVLNF